MKKLLFSDPVTPIYFGCVGQVGHYAFNTSLRNAERYGAIAESKNVDMLCQTDGQLPPAGPPPNGVAALHVTDNATVLSFWDNTVDRRPGSHSTFLLPGKLSFMQAATLARHHFPAIFARYKFEIVERPTHADGKHKRENPRVVKGTIDGVAHLFDLNNKLAARLPDEYELYMTDRDGIVDALDRATGNSVEWFELDPATAWKQKLDVQWERPTTRFNPGL